MHPSMPASLQGLSAARFNGWVSFLLRRDSLAAGQLSAAAGCIHSVFVDADSRLLQCAENGDSTSRDFSTTRGIRFQCVSTSRYVSLALSEDGDVGPIRCRRT
jgi:hypothetical protein